MEIMLPLEKMFENKYSIKKIDSSVRLGIPTLYTNTKHHHGAKCL